MGVVAVVNRLTRLLGNRGFASRSLENEFQTTYRSYGVRFLFLSTSLTALCYVGKDDADPVGLMDRAFQAMVAVQPIEKKLVICGDLSERVNQAVKDYQIDLLVCGHRQSFWSLLTSSARQLMNTVPCDLLVVPLQK